MFFPFPSVRRVKFDCQRLTRAFMSFFFFFLFCPQLPQSSLSLSLSLSLSYLFYFFIFPNLSHLFLACTLSSLQLSLFLSRLYSSSHISTCLLEHNHLGRAGWARDSDKGTELPELTQKQRTQTKQKDLNPYWNEKLVFNVND
jgi:hypothetical protein